jgi:hypothetical protein
MRLAALLLAVVAACSDSESTTPGTATGNSVTQDVGPEGGTIVVGGATVTIPKGALTETKKIMIAATDEAPPAGFTAVSKVFRCGPTGTTFAEGVTMEMPFTDDGKPVKMFWTAGSETEFKDIGGTSTNGKTIVATVKHFSGGFVGRANQ